MRTYAGTLVTMCMFAMALVGGTGCGSKESSPTEPAATTMSHEETGCVVASDTVLGYTNYERCLQGIALLSANSLLDAAAQCHSNDMATRGYFAHDAPEPPPCGGTNVGQRISASGYRWESYGENLASGHGSARSVVAAWMASPTHGPNILNPRFEEMGVGKKGRIWSQVFGSR